MLRTLFPTLLTLLFPVFALAISLPAQLQQDFSPQEGAIILATPGQILIDRDQTSGAVVGDLFAVVTPGTPIVHPVSGAILGVSQSVGGWLRVASVRSGYSETTPLAANVTAKTGGKVSRFFEAEAVMVDPAGTAADLYSQLQRTLPHLRWLGYFTATTQLPSATLTPRLLFTTANNSLEVREERSGLLRRYPLGLALPVQTTVPSATPAVAVASSYWNSVSEKGEARALEVADLDGDGKNETITATLHGLKVGRFNGKEYQILAETDFGYGRSILSVDAMDSDGDGKSEIWVTAYFDNGLSSLVILWDGKKSLKTVADKINLWIRALNIPGQGRTLLAQKMSDDDFSGSIMTIALKNGKIVTSPSGMTGQSPLYGLARIGTQENILSVQLNDNEKLVVSNSSGEVVQEGDETYGGSEAYIVRVDPLRSGRDVDMTRNVYPSPRFESIGSRFLLAPVNIGSRAFARQRLFKTSRIDLLEWDGAMLRQRIIGRVESGYLADYRYADIDNDGVKEIVSLIVTTRPSFSSDGRYLILVNETVLPE